MKYFNRERYLALQKSQDDAMDAADAEWHVAAEDYEAQLKVIRPQLPDSVLQFLDGYYLHDARVLSIGLQGDSFVVSLQLDVPPHDLLTIAYKLAGSPEVTKEAFPWVSNANVADWLYDELELIHDDQGKHFVHSILLSSGWQVKVPFRDMQTTTAYPFLPHPRVVTPGGQMPAPQSA